MIKSKPTMPKAPSKTPSKPAPKVPTKPSVLPPRWNGPKVGGIKKAFKKGGMAKKKGC